jgi:hypothetical protein
VGVQFQGPAEERQALVAFPTRGEGLAGVFQY